MVTHDPIAASYGDAVVFVADGSVVEEVISPTAADRGPHDALGRLTSSASWLSQPSALAGPPSSERSSRWSRPQRSSVPPACCSSRASGRPSSERLAATDIVISASQSVAERQGDENDAETAHASVAERRRLDASMLAVVRAVPGVGAATPEITFPANLVAPGGDPVTGPGGAPSFGHSWVSSPLAPFAIVAGREPTSADEIVVDRDLLRRAGATVGDRRSITVRGRVIEAAIVGAVATPSTQLRHQSTMFFTDAAASSLYGRPGETDTIGVTVRAGADQAAVADAIRDRVGPEVCSTYRPRSRQSRVPRVGRRPVNPRLRSSALFGGSRSSSPSSSSWACSP